MILCGEGVKRQKNFELTTKEYQFEVLFGLQTDTYDILGLTAISTIPSLPNDLLQQIKESIPKYMGKFQQSYPPFSSARVNGKPLFQWVKEGKLSEVVIPTVEVEISKLNFLKSYELEVRELRQILMERISKVTSGDFRQKEIIEKWKIVLDSEENKDKKILIVQMVATVSPGTYIRSLAHRLGQDLGTGALAFDIFR